MTQTTPKSRRIPLRDTSPRKIFLQKEDIASYVFMKCHVSDSNNPRITEIALIVLSSMDFKNEFLASGDLALCRFKDVLVLTFDPQTNIQEQDSVNSELKLTVLKDGKKLPFDEDAVDMINQFLSLQPTPVCIFSHGGNAFDFRSLCNAVNQLDKHLIDGLHCVDTLDMFSNYDSEISEARIIDHHRYFLDNVYRRYFEKLPAEMKYDAKSCVLRLIDILREVPTKFWDTIPYKNFTSYASKSMNSQGLSSPMKKFRFSDENGCSTTVAPAYQYENHKIETYIFFDLETTGLDTSTDGIVELCAYAINKNYLTYCSKVPAHNALDIVPRVTDQINMMILSLSNVSEIASSINGITREGLELRKKECFTVKMARFLESFIERQKEPVCLIAHNGFKFDFPMLRCHLDRTKTTNPLWKRIFCTDSLIVHRSMFPEQRHSLKLIFENVTSGFHISLPSCHSAEGDVLRLIMITRLHENMLDRLECEKKLFCELPLVN